MAGKHQEAVATLRGFVETATGGMARLTELRGKLPAAQGKLQRLLGDTGLSVEQGCEAISRLLDEVVAARIATGRRRRASLAPRIIVARPRVGMQLGCGASRLLA